MTVPLALAVGLASAPAALTVRSPDAVPIRYETTGQGSPAIVLVHCWTCDRHLWDHARARLARDHQVVTLDLAGHGESGRGRRQWTVGAFGEDVAAVVTALGLERVILVGHSMGGPVILEAAKRLPGKVVGLVPVDTLTNVEDRLTPEQITNYLAPLRADFPKAAAEFLRQYMFVPASDPAVIDAVVRQTTAAPPDIAVAALEATWFYDPGPAFDALRVPIRAINSDKFPTDRAANRRHAPQYDVVFMKGVGHYLMLEDPDRFDGLLAGVVRGIEAEAAAAAVLEGQRGAWNRGDLEAVCSVYDEDSTFVAPAGIFRGRAAVLERYRKRYPDRAAMGTLTFEVQEARATSGPDDGSPAQGVSMVARWRLAYPDKPEATGLTLIVLRPEAGAWRIVQDASF